ncbi:MAG: hypothetical protein K6E58_02220 [Eubacterium sp.]|nr:hypothetical protein [Eubacterium sp.]
MKKFSTALSLILSIVLVVSSITFTPTNAETIQKKQFKFSKMMEVKDELTSDYYYSDSYFADSSYNYNAHLATMSMCAACASSGNTMSTPVYSGLSKDIEALLKANGFDTLFVNEDFNTEPRKDSIGFMFAKKTIKVGNEDYTLIAVNFRNANYGKEWYSNVDVGPGKTHAGFLAAADKAKEALGNYIRNNNIDENVKIWITGYSRGAAISNLLAQSLDDSGFIGKVSVEASDVYAYTFATPSVTAENTYKKPLYKNIYNIVSKYDVVPQVVPEQWNWHRYGEDVYLPSKIDSNYADKKARAQKFLDLIVKGDTIVYDTLPGYKLDIQLSEMKISILPTTPQDVEDTINAIVTALTGSMKSSADYDEVKSGVEKILDVIYDATDEQKSAFVAAIMSKVSDPEFSYMEYIFDLMADGDKTIDLLCDCMDEAGIPIPDTDTKAALKKLIKYIATAITSDLEGTSTAGLTVYNSAMPFISNHYNYKYLAWMQSLDSYYKLDSDNPPKPTPTVKKPGKAKVTYAKRKSSKKIKIKLKKIKNAKGYQVAVCKTKKGKKVIYKKFVKKTKFTLKSKKFKKKKKLYVKARAYNFKTGKKKQYGKWSKVKKVKKK